MPKMKSNRSASKRFKITATGKIFHKKCGKRHLLRKKSSKIKRDLGKYKEVFKGFYSHIAKVLTGKL